MWPITQRGGLVSGATGADEKPHTTEDGEKCINVTDLI
jgi:hypothetical protein